MNITELICQGECETTEFKTSLAEWRDVIETICAFSNRNGGSIFIGVGDNCEVIGVDCGKSTLENLANQIKQNTDPVIYPSIRIEIIEGKSIIVVDVKEFEQKPVLAFGRAFMRVGKSSQKLGYDEIRRLAILTSKVYWDGRVCEGAGLADIDEGKVWRYLERREDIRKIHKPEKLDMSTLLLNLSAAKKVNGDIIPTNAGMLFFGKNPQRFILQSQLRVARFAGRTLTGDFLDRLDCSGTLWEIVEQAEDFVRKNIRLFGFRTEYSFQRIDKFEYPIKAIREAIINALVHRNYFEPADTRIAIFDDRIEIISPGMFPESVTPDKPKHVPVNPLLCQLVYDIGLIEKYGSGIYMINELCEDWGIAKPTYDLSEADTTVIFISGGKSIVISEIEKMGVELNDRQREGLKMILENGKITNADYAENFKISRNTATNDLTELVKKGLIIRAGRGRGSYYTPKI